MEEERNLYILQLEDVNVSNKDKYRICLKIYENYRLCNRRFEGFFYLVKSFEYNRERVEAAYHLIEHYSCIGNFDMAYNYYRMIQPFYENEYLKCGYSEEETDVDYFITNFYLPYHMTIVAFNSGRFIETGIQMYRIIFKNMYGSASSWYISNLFSNLHFYIEHVDISREEHYDFFYWMNKFIGLYMGFLDTKWLKYCKNNIRIINLERRNDRKEKIFEHLREHNITNYEFIVAVDGKQLEPTTFIKELFEGNDFEYRRGVIGCALSHYSVWQQLSKDELNDYYVILEDDVSLVKDFELKVNKVVQLMMKEKIDLCNIGDCGSSVMNYNINRIDIRPYCENIGAYGYIITKKGAIYILDKIHEYKIQCAIDWVLFNYLGKYSTSEYLVYTQSYQRDFNLDTDIQSDYDCLDFSNI